MGIDDKGRILIPANIRKMLNSDRVVKIRVVDNKLIVEAISDPVEKLIETVIKGSTDIEEEINRLRREAEKEAIKGVEERWF
jgi:DNA-binding transcriptional regulator/RsmH inhibitor MraZ